MASKGGELDLNSDKFNVDSYVSKLLKEKSLDALVAEEENMVNCVRRLDSDVHQIVYENYNKFLTATSSVRKIEKEFKQLDTEMQSLSESMSSISRLVKELSPVIDGKKGQASTLARSYRTVHAVQFVSELPATLQSLLDERQFTDLVHLFIKANKSLTPYIDVTNVKDVMDQVSVVMEQTEKELRDLVGASASSVEAAGEAISLLSQLGVPNEQLQSSVLQAAEATLRRDLDSLIDSPSDVLEMVDAACSSFLPDLALCASLYRSHFTSTMDLMMTRLHPLVDALNDKIRHALLNATAHDTALTVRSLDRFYSKCSAISKLLPELSNVDACSKIVKEVSTREVKLCRDTIGNEFASSINNLRESLADATVALTPLISNLLGSALLQIKTALAHLLLFTASDVAFSSSPQSSTSFRSPFARLVYDEVLVGANKDACTQCLSICSTLTPSMPSFALVLALFAHEWTTKYAQLEILCKEQFSIANDEAASMSKEDEISSMWRSSSHQLLMQYVQHTAVIVGDPWCNSFSSLAMSAQPRGVSKATRQLGEQIRTLSDTVASVLGEEIRRDSRQQRSSAVKQVAMPSDSLKDSLWSERVDLHATVHFKKSSMLVAIAKGVLKSGIEGVRMNTLTAHSMQQIQVDVAYLQDIFSYLIGDDTLLTSLFDAILSSSLRRCSNPQLLHPNVVASLMVEEEELNQ